ncbi:anti-sigma-K factor RskA [Litoreibacter halocynthiae]|uniref:Anti-sigma-K factor RskA n=1 Tax=Litoreibacter halocynthiae TaxID=1242689 RepID=A0A4V3EVX2_9RHOB|nr:anti-sigma factor [Litoreibacter halocynthiae]TDT74755.1 anti-sigma-K factor RskA [Litoreibacter halocynthiae]
MTSDPETPEEDRALAAEYALRLLSKDEEAAFEARMLDDRHLEELVAETVNQFAPLADEIAEETPSRAVKAALLADLFGEAPAATSLWERVGLWRAASFAATAAAAVMAVMLITQSAPGPAPQLPAAERGALFVSEIAAGDDSLRVLAVYDADTGSVQVNRTAGSAAPDRALELWAIAGDNPPVSLGVLPVGQKGQLVLPENLRGDVSSLVLAISDEPLGGSPTGAPTGAVLAVGQVTDI